MDFKVDAVTLQKELSVLANVTDGKHPLCSQVFIESNGTDKIKLTTTDIDTTVQGEIEATVKVEGSICVMAKKLLDIARSVKGEIRLKKEANSWVTATVGKSKFRLAGLTSEQFPPIKLSEDSSIVLDSEKFSNMIKSVVFAITTEESRYNLSGAKLEIANGKARMVATDGHRLSLIETDCSGEVDALIPKKALNQINKLPKGNIVIAQDSNHLYFSSGHRNLTARKLGGSFPQYQGLMQQQLDKVCKVKTDVLREAISRMALVSDEPSRSVKATFKPDEIELHTVSSMGEEGEDMVEAAYKGDEVTLYFNWSYLSQFLPVVNEDYIMINFKDGNTTMQLSFDETKYLLMPLRM